MRVQAQQKRKFLHHLEQWSLNHDSSLHFHGKISLSTQGTRLAEDFELGKPVKCVLTDTSFTDARQKITIKLFLPQGRTEGTELRDDQDERRDSMEPYEIVRDDHIRSDGSSGQKKGRQDQTQNVTGHYRMVVRCGAGWISAREYFSKVYFSHLEPRRKIGPKQPTQDDYLARKSQALGPAPSENDSVIIRPLFHAWHRLAPELQEMILMTAAGLSRSFNLCADDYGTLRMKRDKRRSAISLSTLLRISRNINQHMLPYIYHSTDFHFGLTGFTNFLWQSGPTKRREIRRLTFHFGKLALLHCIRWLAPDPIFALFEPPVITTPRPLQYFWRCQIQDLVKDVELFTLTINIKQISRHDIAMIMAIINIAFSNTGRISFIETDKNGVASPVDMNDKRLAGLGTKHTWKELCLAYYESHRTHSYFYKFDLLRSQVEDLETVMAEDETFFNTPFSPMSVKEDFKGVGDCGVDAA